MAQARAARGRGGGRLNADEDQRARAHDDETGPRVLLPRPAAAERGACEWAQDTLAAFDAEHPQIVTALNEQEAAEVRRRLGVF
ncbi:hypothetical protein O1L68_40365 [Streptomyces lydicus]|nr:hypothetical protein [Streptomyces lydicus]